MTRTEWLSLYRELRVMSAHTLATCNGSVGAIKHGSTYWTIKHGRHAGLTVYPSIIRDRSTCSRIDDALGWAMHYRRLAKKERHVKRNHVAAALACIGDAREIRLSSSVFHAIAA